MSSQDSRLGIDDTDFLVASFVARSPRHMMMRELVMNAVEAVSSSQREKTIEILGLAIEGVRKLAIRNLGAGMTREELYRMCDLGTSIRKIKSVDGNFGMGGKISSLASNPAGVRYRSCAGGRVFEVVLGESNGKYGRQWVKSRSGIADIHDVTDIARAEGLPVDGDWTEVLLHGASAKQDTVMDPYGEANFSPEGWIWKALDSRFFRVPEGVEIRLDASLGIAARQGAFVTLQERISQDSSQYEVVNAGDGVKVHYAYIDPETSGPRELLAGRVGVVFRSELFDVEIGSPWAYNAPSFGVPFASKYIIVLIELDDDYPVFAEQYRQFLCYKGGEASRVLARDFARIAYTMRPEWLKATLAGYSAATETVNELRGSLGELARQLSSPDCVIEPPQLYVLRDLEDLKERWLDARAARYEPDTNELFVNAVYPSIGRFRDELLATLAARDRGDARLEALANGLAEEAAIDRLARTVLRVKSRALSQAWTPGNRDLALSGEALSVVADDLEMWESRMRERLRSAAAQNDPRSTVAAGLGGRLAAV